MPACNHRRVQRVGALLKLLYWLAVLAISLAFVVGLILFFESRDQSSVERSAGGAGLRAS